MCFLLSTNLIKTKTNNIWVHIYTLWALKLCPLVCSECHTCRWNSWADSIGRYKKGFIGDYFYMRINTHVLLQGVFMAARQCSAAHMFTLVEEHWLAHWCVLAVFWQQWRSMTQRNKMYQVLDMNLILVHWISSLLVLVFSFDVLRIKYRVSYPLSRDSYCQTERLDSIVFPGLFVICHFVIAVPSGPKAGTGPAIISFHPNWNAQNFNNS